MHPSSKQSHIAQLDSVLPATTPVSLPELLHRHLLHLVNRDGAVHVHGGFVALKEAENRSP
jgi:hypothetical protein